MRAEQLLQAVGSVDEKWLEESGQKTSKWKKLCCFTAAAACLCLMAFGFIHHVFDTGFQTGNGGGGHDSESSVFMSYAGPVFSLTLMEGEKAITAERNLTFDFSNYNKDVEDAENAWMIKDTGSIIKDEYVLKNISNTEKKVTAVYPFTASFRSVDQMAAQIRVNGKTVHAKPYAGIYSKEVKGLGDVEVPRGIFETGDMNSWEDYKALIVSESYMQSAFKETVDLTDSVIVYQFVDSYAPKDKYTAATVAMDFKLPKGVKTFSYGLEGYGWDSDTGKCQYSYFVPVLERKNDLKMLIVWGGDIKGYTLQGYKDGGCEKNAKVKDVTAKVIRREMPLGELLKELVADEIDVYHTELMGEKVGNTDKEENILKTNQIYAAVSEMMRQYLKWDQDMSGRYEGSMEMMIEDIIVMQRVFYQPFEITIPANGSTTVQIQSLKDASFDFACSGSENAGIDGYDMLTRLGSSLNFAEQTATIEDYGCIEIVRQNFGFDLKRGVRQVELDLDQDRYYLEIRKIERK